MDLTLKHFVTLDSTYEFVHAEENEDKTETWTYLVYLNKSHTRGLELTFDVRDDTEFTIENLIATTVQYGVASEPCSICQSTDAEMCQEYEREKLPYEKDHAFLHECGFDEDELLDFAMELYIHDQLEDVFTQDDFDMRFRVESEQGRTVQLYELDSEARFRVENNQIYHVLSKGEELEECPFCQLNELAVYAGDEVQMKCSVLSQNIPYLRQLIANRLKGYPGRD